jgi:transcriptional regulator with XRE-family HTH domain
VFHFARDSHMTVNMTGHTNHSEGNAPMSQTKAAAALGVTREHLNRVLRGHRQSPPLLARFAALQEEEAKRMSEETTPRFSQETTRTAGQTPNAIDPAAANETIEWVELIGKLGLTAVAVRAPYSAELWQNSGFEEDLGRELAEAHLGQYDSARYFNPITCFFYVRTQDLAAGLQLIKARLAAIGLLPSVKIGVADQESKAWRVFYPELGPAGT